MKNIRKFLLIIFLFINFYSCKNKISHEEALKYYVTIQLQTKEVSNLVKEFSPTLSRFIRESASSKKNIKVDEIDSFKNSYSKLIQQIDERLLILNEMKGFEKEILMRSMAINYIKDTCRILSDVMSIIDTGKNVGFKQKVINRENFRVYKMELVFDDSRYKIFSEAFRKKYNISNFELSKYALQ